MNKDGETIMASPFVSFSVSIIFLNIYKDYYNVISVSKLIYFFSLNVSLVK